uniref:Uncharacterized protein n=1 Tax=Rhizophora mucronata TaxID=61149 RepID=A0A2P2Q5M8_RHIMU
MSCCYVEQWTEKRDAINKRNNIAQILQ